jgi:glycerophosphoryl diester phosphodiesterase
MPKKQGSHMTLLIAHRGASAEAPENTLASIKRAIDLNVDYIEIDVHLTADGIPVVIHDETTMRTSGGLVDWLVASKSLQSLKTVDIGSWFSSAYAQERIPTFREVVTLNLGRCGLMIEIKKGPHSAKDIVTAVSRELPQGVHCIVGSFEMDIVKEVRRQRPDLPTMAIVEEMEMIAPFCAIGITQMALWHQIAGNEQLATLQQQHIEVWSFTVDTLERFKELIAAGVGGVITNNPRFFLER